MEGGRSMLVNVQGQIINTKNISSISTIFIPNRFIEDFEDIVKYVPPTTTPTIGMSGTIGGGYNTYNIPSYNTTTAFSSTTWTYSDNYDRVDNEYAYFRIHMTGGGTVEYSKYIGGERINYPSYVYFKREWNRKFLLNAHRWFVEKRLNEKRNWIIDVWKKSVGQSKDIYLL